MLPEPPPGAGYPRLILMGEPDPFLATDGLMDTISSPDISSMVDHMKKMSMIFVWGQALSMSSLVYQPSRLVMSQRPTIVEGSPILEIPEAGT